MNKEKFIEIASSTTMYLRIDVLLRGMLAEGRSIKIAAMPRMKASAFFELDVASMQDFRCVTFEPKFFGGELRSVSLVGPSSQLNWIEDRVFYPRTVLLTTEEAKQYDREGKLYDVP